jgi:hypothetical protein
MTLTVCVEPDVMTKLFHWSLTDENFNVSIMPNQQYSLHGLINNPSCGNAPHLINFTLSNNRQFCMYSTITRLPKWMSLPQKCGSSLNTSLCFNSIAGETKFHKEAVWTITVGNRLFAKQKH